MEITMTTCANCVFFFPVPEDAGDYEPGKGDCVTEKQDAKGKYWTSTPVFENDESCDAFSMDTV
jgi:benzylsuccinate synthase